MSSESVAAFDAHNVISANFDLTRGLVDQVHLNVGRRCLNLLKIRKFSLEFYFR